MIDNLKNGRRNQKNLYFTRRQLREASEIVCQKIALSLPHVSQCEHTFSKRFLEGMQRMVEQNDRRKAHLHRKQFCAVIVACICVLFLWLAVDTGARASVIGWIKNVYEKVIIYHFGGEGEHSINTIEMPRWIPEGYEMKENGQTNLRSYAYYQYADDLEKGFVVECIVLNSGELNLELLIGTKKYEHQAVSINGCPGELYIFQDDTDTNNLVWVNEEMGVLFNINGTLSGDELLRIAESMPMG
ncbi:MAG: DUF4367 domain-containing protein [Acetatifactor sp.]